MAYKGSPRPNFSEATDIPYRAVTRFLWGDPEAGFVDDWIYASTDKIHQLVFGLPPWGAFRHSRERPTVFGADEVLYVLSGTLGAANPETGEVHVAKPGEAVFFRKNTWHHGYNLSGDPLRVLEYFAPPPSTGTSGPYARTRPYVEEPIFRRNDLVGHWPMHREEAEARATMRVLRDGDLLWELDDPEQGALTGLYVSTEHLTAGRTSIAPGKHSGIHRHGGDECLYLLSGILNVQLPEAEGKSWFELHPQDGFYVPAGVPHRYWNMGKGEALFMFGIAPNYAS